MATGSPNNPVSIAEQEAKRQNKRIEIESYRSETATTFANPDGKTLHTEVHSAPIRIKKDGTWHAIDTTLVEEGGLIRPKVAQSDLMLSPGGDTQLIKIKGEQGWAVIAAPNKLPKVELKGNTATYRNAYGANADLVITVTPTGFRQEIVIRQRPGKDLKLRVPVDLPNGLKFDKRSTPSVLSNDGRKLVDLPGATMIDAKAMADPESGRVGSASASIEQTAQGDTVVLTAKADFLADPAVTYPVTVMTASDTWVGAGVPADTFVSHSYPSGLSNSSLDRIIAGRSNSGTVTWRGYVRFDFPDELLGGTVINGDLRLWNHRSHTCDDNISPGIVARMITGDWTVSSLTLANQPSVTSTGQVGIKGAYDEISCPEGEGELWYSIEQMVQSWMNGTPHRGVQFSSASETVSQNWRWYRSSEYGGYETYPATPRGPVLIIDYEPDVIEQDVVIPTELDNLTIEGPISYEDAIAGQLEIDSGPPAAPEVTPEQVQALMEQATDTYEVNPDDLVPEEEDPTPDQTPPSVIDTVPLATATEVGTDTIIQATFDEPVSGVSVSVKNEDGATVPGESAMAGEEKTIVFTPSQPLAANTAYTVEVNGAQDAEGNVLAAPYIWSFTTAGASASPTPTPTESPTEQEVSLPLQTDMWIDSWGSVEADGSTLWAGTYRYESSQIIERTYLKFDTSSLVGKTITDAKLELWNTQAYGCGNSASGIKAQRVTAVWSAGTLNWNNQPAATTGGEVSTRDPGECSGTTPADDSAVWSWPLTEIVQSWASGQSNYGLVLRGADESASAPEYDRGWEASEAEPATRPPRLTVKFVDGTAPSPTSTSTPTPGPGTDTTPPTVVEVTPADGAENVSPNTQVRVTFSESVTNASLSLVDVFTESEVPGSMSMNAAGTVLTFTPHDPLDFIYYADVSGARDAAGNVMQPFSWSFAVFSWMSAKSNYPATAKASEVTPNVSKAWTRSVDQKGAEVVTSTTPQLIARVADPLHRNATVEFHVEHDPKERSQGRGLIWSGSAPNVPATGTGIAQVPEGKLKDGWKVRWRSRAVIGSTAGPWSGWESMAVREEKTVAGVDRTPPAGLSSGDTVAAAAPKTFPYYRVDWSTCYTDLLAQVKRERPGGTWAVGHTTNPYNWCAAKGYGFPVYKLVTNARTGEVISEEFRGQVEFNLAARIYTYAGGKAGSANAETDRPSGKNSRDITFTWRITGVRYRGDLSYFTPMTLRAGIAVSSKCQVNDGPQHNGTPGKNALFTEWVTNAEAEWTIRAPKSLGTGRSLLSECTIIPTLSFASPRTITTPGGDVSRDISIQHPVIRCDTAALIEKYTGGCVLTDVSPVLIFDATRIAGIKESAKHVWDAYYHTEWTYPIMSGKKVPGRAPHGVLHRIVDGAVPGLEDPDEAPSGTISKNRAYSISKCREKWPSVKPKEEGLDCDEFPFASTKEGSLSSGGNFSARYIGYSDNRKSGNQLGLFYQQMRRLGNDPFWVFTNPLPAERDQMPPRWP